MESIDLVNINTTSTSYESLIRSFQTVRSHKFEQIQINLTNWFSANMSAVLGGLLDSLDSTNKIEIHPDLSIKRILEKNRFLSNYGFPRIYDSNNTTIPYLKLKAEDSRYFNDYVINELLSKNALPKMSDALKKKIAESIYEIFVNAQMHSGSPYIYTCGQFYPYGNNIEFTIVDMGRGFKANVNERFSSNLTSLQSIRWAIGDGNTTKLNAPGGLGLSLLKDFIYKNNGKIQIISGDGFFEYGKETNEKQLSVPFPGSIVNMCFKTDDKNSYLLSTELKSEDIF